MTKENLTFGVIRDVADVVKVRRKRARAEATQPCGRLRSLSRTRRSEQAGGMAAEERGPVRKAEDWPVLWNVEGVQGAGKPAGHWRLSP